MPKVIGLPPAWTQVGAYRFELKLGSKTGYILRDTHCKWTGHLPNGVKKSFGGAKNAAWQWVEEHFDKPTGWRPEVGRPPNATLPLTGRFAKNKFFSS